MSTRILFVCLGNICRSPAAEGVFRSLSDKAGLELTIDSAGTAGYHIGKAPYGPMQVAAVARGYDLSDLRARQFTAADFTDYDLLIGMDVDNIADMKILRPNGNTTPVRLFTDYTDGSKTSDIPDPYYTRDFAGALQLVEEASAGLIAQMLDKKM
ncbi:MAG: phosphotyrosine protein phosphatase [Marinosulfonomonas sp.]|nr:MAG: phosphotyrosine protein phosphatase [Marinosulfonomonas sp.]